MDIITIILAVIAVLIIAAIVWLVFAKKKQAVYDHTTTMVNRQTAPTSAQESTNNQSDTANKQALDKIDALIQEQNYNHAESESKRLLAVDPNNSAAMLKLLQIYGLSNNRTAFHHLYGQIKALKSPDLNSQAESYRQLLQQENQPNQDSEPPKTAPLNEQAPIDFDENYEQPSTDEHLDIFAKIEDSPSPIISSSTQNPSDAGLDFDLDDLSTDDTPNNEPELDFSDEFSRFDTDNFDAKDFDADTDSELSLEMPADSSGAIFDNDFNAGSSELDLSLDFDLDDSSANSEGKDDDIFATDFSLESSNKGDVKTPDSLTTDSFVSAEAVDTQKDALVFELPSNDTDTLLFDDALTLDNDAVFKNDSLSLDNETAINSSDNELIFDADFNDNVLDDNAFSKTTVEENADKIFDDFEFDTNNTFGDSSTGGNVASNSAVIGDDLDSDVLLFDDVTFSDDDLLNHNKALSHDKALSTDTDFADFDSSKTPDPKPESKPLDFSIESSSNDPSDTLDDKLSLADSDPAAVSMADSAVFDLDEDLNFKGTESTTALFDDFSIESSSDDVISDSPFDDTITQLDKLSHGDFIGETAVGLPADLDFVNSLDSASITLGLANQYLALGEQDSAKRLLEEVAAQGSSEQQANAKALLAKII